MKQQHAAEEETASAGVKSSQETPFLNPPAENRRRGAPAGNQYARKHGFYSAVLDEDERQDFYEAVTVHGLDAEIALLRTKIKSVMRHDPDNLNLIIQAVTTLARLVATRHQTTREDRQGLKDAISNVFKDIALPLGISLGSLLDR
jgi:hypothetical protein